MVTDATTLCQRGNVRFVSCFVHAADDAGLPEDPAFRAALRGYIEWAVREVLAYSPRSSAAPAGAPMPQWSWNGLENGVSPDP